MSVKLKKILYVEDDDDIAELTEMTLTRLGNFDVFHCPDGMSALASFSDYDPDLVLMDVMMPGIDGVETFERMKALPKGLITPLIFMTAKAQFHEQEKYQELGALGVILKPCDPMILCDKLNAYWAQYHRVGV